MNKAYRLVSTPTDCSPTCRAGAYVPRASTGQTNPNSFCSLCACFASYYYHPPCSIPSSRMLSCTRVVTSSLQPMTRPAFYALKNWNWALRLTSIVLI